MIRICAYSNFISQGCSEWLFLPVVCLHAIIASCDVTESYVRIVSEERTCFAKSI